MNDVIASPFGFPAVRRKKVTAAFDGGRLTSDGGVLLLAQAVRELRICARLYCRSARSLSRDPFAGRHLAWAVLTICCDYEDADDLDALRDDPGFRPALGELPGSGAGLASQPMVSRWENAPTTREQVRMATAMVSICSTSYPAAFRPRCAGKRQDRLKLSGRWSIIARKTPKMGEANGRGSQVPDPESG